MRPRPEVRPTRRRRALGRAAAAVAALLLLAAGMPTDPLAAQQHHLRTVRALEAWDVRRGQGAVVAVLDTGVDLDHPDLAGRLVDGIDLVEPDTPPDDPQGHGTIVAGIIAATADNGRGVAGVAPLAQVMPIRVLDAQGRGTSDVVAAGIRHAVAEGVQVINLSLAEVKAEQGALQLSLVADRDVQEAIAEAADAGIAVVAAAGNDGDTSTPYAYDAPVLVVGATQEDGQTPWEDSNVDDRTLFAPGVEMFSTWHEGRYAKADGTSFATPVVAAGAAMLLGAGLELEAVRTRLIDTAAPVRGPGLGRVDLAAALEGVEPAPAPTTTPIPPPPAPEPQPQPAEPDGTAPPDALDQVVPVEEAFEPPATVTAAPPPIEAGTPVQTVAPEPQLEVAEAVVPPSPTAQATPPPLAVDETAGSARGTAIPIATALLGADVVLAGWLLGRRRG